MMRVFYCTDTTKNLCDTCGHEFATCNAAWMEFGNGVGNDNVIKCAGYDWNKDEVNKPDYVKEEF